MSKRFVVLMIVASVVLTLGAGQNLTAQPLQMAIETSETLANAATAAVLDITEHVTVATVEADSEAVTLLIGRNPAIRLIGEIDPLGNNSQPHGAFEQEALEAAINHGETTQELQGNHLVTMIPLVSGPVGEAGGNCNLCHTTFTDGQRVGVLGLRVQLPN